MLVGSKCEHWMASSAAGRRRASIGLSLHVALVRSGLGSPEERCARSIGSKSVSVSSPKYRSKQMDFQFPVYESSVPDSSHVIANDSLRIAGAANITIGNIMIQANSQDWAQCIRNDPAAR